MKHLFVRGLTMREQKNLKCVACGEAPSTLVQYRDTTGPPPAAQIINLNWCSSCLDTISMFRDGHSGGKLK